MKLQATVATALTTTLAAARPPSQVQRPLAGIGAVQIPQLGYGTWNLANASLGVSLAIQAGYEHIDAAAIYGNQVQVGEGIRDGLARTGLDREDIWVTSKLWNAEHGHQHVEAALDETLEELGLGYLDLYLMHWPVENVEGRNFIEFIDTWRGFEALIGTGKVRYIGICNFDLYQLSQIQLHSNIKPLVHQFELHPYLQQWEFLHYHHELGIAVTAYSPLGNLNPTYNAPTPPLPPNHHSYPTILQDSTIGKIAEARGCTNAQVALSWGMGRGTSVIPKASSPEHIVENVDAVKCYLHEEDYDAIEAIEGRYVKRFNKPGKNWGLQLFQGLDDPDDCRYD